MQDRVWVIDDREYKASKPGPPEAVSHMPPLPKGRNERNPALAFSLSMLLWGGGHLYNGQWKTGALLFSLMANFYLLLGLAAAKWGAIAGWMDSSGSVTPSFALAALGGLYLAGLLLWMGGAVHAYRNAAASRAAPFEGVKKPVLPFFCSLLVPGWGQFLNSQKKKGVLFLLVAAAGFVALPATVVVLRLWPTLEPSRARLFLEGVVTASVAASPLVLLAWILGAFDAAKVCLEDSKKQPFRNRVSCVLNNMRNRRWLRQWLRGLVLQARLAAVLSLVLLISMLFSHRYFPGEYYEDKLEGLREGLQQREMTVLPRLIDVIIPESPAPEPPGRGGPEGFRGRGGLRV